MAGLKCLALFVTFISSEVIFFRSNFLLWWVANGPAAAAVTKQQDTPGILVSQGSGPIT